MTRRSLIALVLTLWFGTALPAAAQDPLAAAKLAGQVGERPDGLAGLVAGSAPADVKALVDRVNAQRLQRYRQVADTNGTSVDKVQAVAGAQLVQRTPPGQFVMNAAGRWVKK